LARVYCKQAVASEYGIAPLPRQVATRNMPGNKVLAKLGKECNVNVNVKETWSLNCKKLVSAAQAKICGLFLSIGRLWLRTDSRRPIYINSWLVIFLHFLLET
jgi:hypothetical protein